LDEARGRGVGLLKRFLWQEATDEQLRVEETESFLTGGYARRLLDRAQPVPEWVWLNLLTHTSEHEVAERSAELMVPGSADAVTLLWQGAVAVLLRELADAAERSGRTLGDLQQGLILNFEDRRPPALAVPVLGPSRFVQDVRKALDRWGGCDP